MIEFFYETNFKIEEESKWKNWIKNSVLQQGFQTKEINYIFSDDEYLWGINIDFLSHDYYTDVIGFQYTNRKELSGDIYISIERVKDNAQQLSVSFEDELARVMIHGILHFMGFRDKTENEISEMRKAENQYLQIFKESN